MEQSHSCRVRTQGPDFRFPSLMLNLFYTKDVGLDQILRELELGLLKFSIFRTRSLSFRLEYGIPLYSFLVFHLSHGEDLRSAVFVVKSVEISFCRFIILLADNLSFTC